MENEDFSCIKEVTKIVNLTLPSMYSTNEISGICDTLETWKRQYVKQLQGILVGYKNVSLTSKHGYIKADSAVMHFNVKATFEIFYPTIGSIIKGKVNRISQDYIGCLVHDTINVTVHQTTDISSDISSFINLDHFILFKITRIIFKSKIIHVKGKITEECVTLMKDAGMINENIDVCDNDMQTTCSSPDFSSSNNLIYNNPSTSNSNIFESEDFATFNDSFSQISPPKKKKKHKKSKENPSMSPSFSGSLENDTDRIESSQSPSNTKKRKHKKSDSTLTSPTSAVEDDTDRIQSSQSPINTKKRKRKKSDSTLTSSTSADETESMHPKKKIKTEALINNNINEVELTQSPDKSRKRKRKKSDQNLASTSDAFENETEPIHPKKKMKTEKHTMNNGIESDMFSSISHSENSSMSAATPVVDSPNIGVDNPVIKVEVLSPVKKKKHKKSKSSLETFFPEDTLRSEMNETKTESNLHQSFNEASPSRDVKSEDFVLTSPDIFDKDLNEGGSETEQVKPKKKKKGNSDKDRTRKKKKDKKIKKDSKKEKKKKPKVISTKKKLLGHKVKLKKKKSKDSKKGKSKDSNKGKSKKEKIKSEAE